MFLSFVHDMTAVETAENVAVLNVDYSVQITTVLGVIDSSLSFIFDQLFSMKVKSFRDKGQVSCLKPNTSFSI